HTSPAGKTGSGPRWSAPCPTVECARTPAVRPTRTTRSRYRMPANERTETAPTTYNQRGRAVEAMAFSLLRKRGYSVIRSMRYSSAVHLVAWCDWSRPLFVHVKRTRQEVAGATDVAALWRDDIAALQ